MYLHQSQMKITNLKIFFSEGRPGGETKASRMGTSAECERQGRAASGA